MDFLSYFDVANFRERAHHAGRGGQVGVKNGGAGNSGHAYEQQISAMVERICYFLRKNFGLDDEQAKDLAHDSVVAAIQRVREPKFALQDGVQLATFVHSIAKHKALDFLKGRPHRQHRSIDDEDIKSRIVVESEWELTEADIEKIKKLIDRLGEPQNRILYLIYYEGYKVADVAEQIKMAATQVSMHKFTALKQLREWCEEEGISLALLVVVLWNLWRLIHGL